MFLQDFICPHEQHLLQLQPVDETSGRVVFTSALKQLNHKKKKGPIEAEKPLAVWCSDRPSEA